MKSHFKIDQKHADQKITIAPIGLALQNQAADCNTNRTKIFFKNFLSAINENGASPIIIISRRSAKQLT